ncbi:MAG TPA: hypothetical protein DDW27_17185 [Bacteroidales bacterium]|nr:hypothetical protein [Bacteroidales bacterium]
MKRKSKVVLFLSFPLLLIITMASQNGLSELQPDDNLEHITVFRRGEDGYHTYRIPSIVQAKNGTLIAFAEGRRDNGGDPGNGHIDLVYKVSHDGGRTWSSLRLLEKSQEGWGASNPTVVLSRKSGRIFIFYDGWKPGRGGNISHYSRPGTLDNQLWMRFSDDNGNTWSDARDITDQGRDIKRWGNAVFGPGHGIETRTGRLVIPVNAPGKFTDDTLKTASFALFSDDGGQSWKRGEQINAYTTENQIVELDNGQLMINARQKESVSTRWVALSNDQGQTWGQPFPGQVCAQICAALIRYPHPQERKNNLLIWSGIKGPGRSNLVLQLSSDQGKSFPVEILVGHGPSAYSDMTLIDEVDVGILWEGGIESRYEKVFFTRIPRKTISQIYHLSILSRDVHK